MHLNPARRRSEMRRGKAGRSRANRIGAAGAAEIRAATGAATAAEVRLF
jgi:hypothetical protein